VARIDSRGGNVPRQVRSLTFAAAAEGGPGEVDPPPAGAGIEVDGKVVGRLTSVAWSPARGAVVALGSVARAVEPPADAVVRWEGGELPARVTSLPR
jgi:glycine cleavage system aminomethyltransferase T